MSKAPLENALHFLSGKKVGLLPDREGNKVRGNLANSKKDESKSAFF